MENTFPTLTGPKACVGVSVFVFVCVSLCLCVCVCLDPKFVDPGPLSSVVETAVSLFSGLEKPRGAAREVVYGYYGKFSLRD